MKKLTEYNSYKEVNEHFCWSMLWDLFDGNEQNLNIAHECLDRHVDKGIAVRIKSADGTSHEYSFKCLSELSSQFANYLQREGISKGDRVAIMLEPSLAFYACMFGAMKRGAIAVPLFTLFGPEALAQRISDCEPRILIISEEKREIANEFSGLRVCIANSSWMKEIAEESKIYQTNTSANDLAIFQYTSGTTRQFPEAVKHTHRSVVTLVLAGLFGLGLRKEDHYFCPSSPAWGHGLWHGTIAPLSLGIGTGTYAGKFNPQMLLQALQEFEITNLAAAATVYRMMKNSGLMDRYQYKIKKLSFTGEPIDSDTRDFIERKFGVPICSMYGTTETGVIIASYPGFSDFKVKPGSLGKPVPGWQVTVVDEKGDKAPYGSVGEISVKRRGEWFRVKDAGVIDEDGYFWHKGRADDVIISAGWTISAVEVEDMLQKHPDVLEAAVIGAPDELRGLIVKAFVVSKRKDPEFQRDLQQFVKQRLSAHEYPRSIEFVNELPKTPAGKVNRKMLRDQYAGHSTSAYSQLCDKGGHEDGVLPA